MKGIKGNRENVVLDGIRLHRRWKMKYEYPSIPNSFSLFFIIPFCCILQLPRTNGFSTHSHWKINSNYISVCSIIYSNEGRETNERKRMKCDLNAVLGRWSDWEWCMMAMSECEEESATLNYQRHSRTCWKFHPTTPMTCSVTWQKRRHTVSNLFPIN